jgi:PEP-utilising enzyme, mobile domain
MLSNPAIIAREFGLPAVLATRIGTAQLRDDQVVTVDGTTGTVEILGEVRCGWPRGRFFWNLMIGVDRTRLDAAASSRIRW